MVDSIALRYGVGIPTQTDSTFLPLDDVLMGYVPMLVPYGPAKETIVDATDTSSRTNADVIASPRFGFAHGLSF